MAAVTGADFVLNPAFPEFDLATAVIEAPAFALAVAVLEFDLDGAALAAAAFGDDAFAATGFAFAVAEDDLRGFVDFFAAGAADAAAGATFPASARAALAIFPANFPASLPADFSPALAVDFPEDTFADGLDLRAEADFAFFAIRSPFKQNLTKRNLGHHYSDDKS